MTALAALVLIVVLLLRDDAGDDATATTTSSPSATAPAEPTSTAGTSTPPVTTPTPTSAGGALPGAGLGPFRGGSTPTTDGTYITDVRTAGQSGYDRVVFEFTDVVPTYTVRYADPPFVDIPGDEVAVAGSSFLEVRLDGTSAVELGTELIVHYDGPDRVTGDTTAVTEVVDVVDFEATVVWVIGLVSQRPYVVSTLDDPGRLVIDVAH